MRLMSVPESKYHYLPAKIKLKRAKMFVKLGIILDLNIFLNSNLKKVIDYMELHMLEDDFEYMTIEELILLRGLGFLDNSKIYELFPEEFDFLEGIPVLMWDEL